MKIVWFAFLLLAAYFVILLRHLVSVQPRHPQAPIQPEPLRQQQQQRQQQQSSSGSIVILLQPSPVAQFEQADRLRGIDASWASWTDNSQDIRILAGINNQSALALLLSRIAPVIRLPASLNAFETMLHLMFAALTRTRLKWLMLCNDHTFVIPPNLKHFLSRLDGDLPIYSGNRLQRGDFKDFPMYFASGGAGAIASHVALKYFFIALALNQNPYLLSMLERSPATCSSTSESAVLRDPKGFVCLLNRLSCEDCLMNLARTEVKLSDKVTVILSKSARRSQFPNIQIKIQSEELLLSSNLIHNCDAESKWERTNPGLIFAYCIQAVFQVKFTESRDVSTLAERFNVYGAVRTIVRDFDNWYVEAKAPFNNSTMTTAAALLPTSEFPCTRDLVSLHYVSQKEAGLLYWMLSQHKVSLAELDNLWPSSNQDMGHYSRRIKSPSELSLLHKFITSYIEVKAY